MVRAFCAGRMTPKGDPGPPIAAEQPSPPPKSVSRRRKTAAPGAEPAPPKGKAPRKAKQSPKPAESPKPDELPKSDVSAAPQRPKRTKSGRRSRVSQKRNDVNAQAKRRRGKATSEPDKQDGHNPNRWKKDGPGRPEYEPDERDVKQVTALAGYGMSIERIALVIGISKDTFYKHWDTVFADAVARGQAVVEGKVGQALVEQAMGGSLGHIQWYEQTRLGKTNKAATPPFPAGGVSPAAASGATEPAPAGPGAETPAPPAPSQLVGLYLPDNGRDRATNPVVPGDEDGDEPEAA